MDTATSPQNGPRFALRGRVVAMDAARTVLPDGVVYVEHGLITDVRPAADPPPDTCRDLTPLDTGATLYPGLIELHNHLPYNVLPLWQVPKKYGDRGQWGGASNPAYHRLVTGPMTVLGQNAALMPAVVRYVEAKALINGTTTSQGIALFSDAGVRRLYRGVVRTVEAADDPALPAAESRIADVEAADAQKFMARLDQQHRLLLHLAEGVDAAAREHFLALQYEPGKWAITENLVGIHCTGLTAPDFTVFAQHGGSMVWSPLSNLLLYGGTADIASAKSAGVPMALGPDWSVSGSKGLLGELKAARLASTAAGGVFSDQDLVAMATCDAARILTWDKALGSLAATMRADITGVAGQDGDPYTALIDATDADIDVVVVGGAPRYGTTALMRTLIPPADGTPETTVPGVPAGHAVDLRQDDPDPAVGDLALADAAAIVGKALAALSGPSQGGPMAAGEKVMAAVAPLLPSPARHRQQHNGAPTWRLALDEIEPTGQELRPRLPVRGTQGFRLGGAEAATATAPTLSGPAIPALSADVTAGLEAIVLDGLTASTNPGFLTELTGEANLPTGYGRKLSGLLT
ncbi:5-methylthioadenosine/S-adenosylhomocysteine deaminase [Catenulispora sp. MAP12-49]|uniref:amidohydrolase family protein n=1 Tax=unclassified Catenulispora TaxID=414885 RepID=UPI0035119096